MSASRDIPDLWAACDLGEIADIRSGYGFPVDLQGRDSGDLPFAKVGDISRLVRGGGTDMATATHHVDRNDLTRLRATPMPTGSIVFAKIGEGIQLNYRALTSVPMLFDNNVMGLVPEVVAVDPRFVLHFMRTINLYPLAVATSVPSVRKTDVSALPFLLPPLPEQRRIVAKLEALTEKSRRAKEALDAIPPLLERFRQSVLAAAFRGDLTAEWRAKNPDVEPADKLLQRIRTERRRRWEETELAKMQAKGKPPQDERWKQKNEEPGAAAIERLPELPEGWTWASLAELLREGLANGRSVPTADDGFPVLRLTALRGERLDLRERKGGAWSAKEAAPFLVRENDFLVSRGNGSLELVGRGGWVDAAPDGVAFPDTMIRIRTHKLVSVEYLALVWKSAIVRTQIERRAKTTAGIFKVSQGDLEAIAVPVCGVTEQAVIVGSVRRQLEMAESLIAKFEQVTSMFDGLNRSILAKAFRGDLVPQDPSDEPASVLLERIRAERAAAASASAKKPTKRR